jgi:hypothetical protein
MATPLDDSYLTSSSSSSSGVSRASRRVSTSSTSSTEEDGWTLSERLLLAAAVQQCGIEHCDWNTVSTAMQARASAGRPRDLFSAEVRILLK